MYEYHVVSGKTRDKLVEAISQNTVHLRDLLERAEEEVREKALDFYPDLGGAPHIIVITVPHSHDEWERKWCVAVAVLELVVLAYAALALGLGTCGVTCSPWVEKRIKEILKIPEEREVLCCMTVGYPNESPEPLSHKRVPVHYIG
jgi:orotidine-5'-phosphate decarboxylase